VVSHSTHGQTPSAPSPAPDSYPAASNFLAAAEGVVVRVALVVVGGGNGAAVAAAAAAAVTDVDG